MMILDMTAELAPFLWGMVGLELLSGIAILRAGLPRAWRPHSSQLIRRRQVPRQIVASAA